MIVRPLQKIRALYWPRLRSGGRNSCGRITARHRGGGGAKRIARLNFRRRLCQVLGRVLSVSPVLSARSARMALVYYPDYALYEYLLCPHGTEASSLVLAWQDSAVEAPSRAWFRFRAFAQATGASFPLRVLRSGQLVFNVERRPGQGGRLCRAAGCFLEVVQKLQARRISYVVLRNRVGRVLYLPGDCMAVLGQASNPHKARQPYERAGVRRGLGRRPSVRGVAMNPVDHPHGGGEGKTSGGRSAVSPWGRLAKGKRTLAPRLRVRRARAILRLRLGGSRGVAAKMPA